MFKQMNIHVNASNEKVNIEIHFVGQYFDYCLSVLEMRYTYHTGVVDEQKSQE